MTSVPNTDGRRRPGMYPVRFMKFWCPVAMTLISTCDWRTIQRFVRTLIPQWTGELPKKLCMRVQDAIRIKLADCQDDHNFRAVPRGAR